MFKIGDKAGGYKFVRDEYVGAREELAIWKRRALEATQEMVDAWSSATELPEGVAEQAVDAALAAQAKQGGADHG